MTKNKSNFIIVTNHNPMNYTEKDFAGCLFNPLKKDLFKTYPRLTEMIKPFDEEATDRLIDGHERKIRYVLALYDPKSPLVKTYPDWAARKVEAARISGYDLVKDKKTLEDLFTCNDDQILFAIHVYLRRFINDRLWGKIIANEETFWEYQMRLMTPVGKSEKDKDEMTAISVKSKLSEDLDKIGSRVDAYKKEFYLGDEALEQAVEQSFRFSPESIADALKNKGR